ncbi:arrestin [Ilyonectria destructans]|nr:arrestin [Ilyonectria destructans]
MNLKLPFLQSQPKELRIAINHHYTSKTYSCGSAINGTIVFTPRNDTPVHMIRVSLVGTARVTCQDLEYEKRSTHFFLRTEMVVPESAYPEPRVFKRGEMYSFPFWFVIPNHLTSNACTHPVASDSVRNSHSLLPPSMGTWERDDMGASITQVEYSVQASIETDSQPCKKAPVAVDKHIINVLPYLPEEPPLSIHKVNIQYALEKTKKVRKNLFSSPEGRITATAVQPKAVNLDSDGYGSSESTVLIDLTFEPLSPSAIPPEINTLSASLQTQTWSRQAPSVNYPNMSLLQDAYTNHTPLFSRRQVQAVWTPSTKEAKGDDSSETIPYSTKVRVPFNLPISRKMFLPTFHTCLVSRTYKIDLALAVGNSTLRLIVPLQIAMQHIGQNMGDVAAMANDFGVAMREDGLSEELWPLFPRPADGDVLPHYRA